MQQKIKTGEETNKYVANFVGSGAVDVLLSTPRFHRCVANKKLTKEVTESWAVIQGVRRILSASNIAEDDKFYVVDLCCGKSLTSALFEILFPNARTIAVDRLPEASTPHFSGHTSYLRADILHKNFEELLKETPGRFALVITASRRARDINSYFNQLGEGIGAYTPPQVQSLSRKPLTVAFEEIAAGKVEVSEEN